MYIATQPIAMPISLQRNGIPGATILEAAKRVAGPNFVEQPRLVMGKPALEVGIASDNPNKGVVVLVGRDEKSLSPMIIKEGYYSFIAVGDRQWTNVERKTMMTTVGHTYSAEYVIEAVCAFAAALEAALGV